ncbi:MAG: hypothetical protein H6Q42_1932 [Deltaproteobacteria bacterium]|nr:hypothetical protein [Deltaproteobacteria bacterium]
MALIIEGGLNLPLPKLVPIRQKFSQTEIKNIPGEIMKLFQRDAKMKRIKKESRVAVTAGSRGIHAIDNWPVTELRKKPWECRCDLPWKWKRSENWKMEFRFIWTKKRCTATAS